MVSADSFIFKRFFFNTKFVEAKLIQNCCVVFMDNVRINIYGI